MSYKLIADAGSTTVKWIVTDDAGEVKATFLTDGINASHCNETQLRRAFAGAASKIGAGCTIGTVFYYGAGCVGETLCENVKSVLRDTFRAADAEVHSDLLAAARASLGDSAGIVCILGTGSNSGLYDGSSITDNVPPLGFILGDEGSGAALGRRLLNGIYKRRFRSLEINDAFSRSFPGLEIGTVIEKVYRSEAPSRFLASFAPFILDNIGSLEMQDMVVGEFRLFIERNLTYVGRCDLPVCFTGGVAFNFAPQLRMACGDCGITLAEVVESPAGGLIKYHRTH